MIKIFCDKCKKEIDGQMDSSEFTYIRYKISKSLETREEIAKDALCDDCTKKIKDALK